MDNYLEILLEFVKKMKNITKHNVLRIKNYISPSPEVFGEEELKRRESFKDDYTIIVERSENVVNFESVIDVGCAQGFLIEPLIEKGYEVKGIEVSEKALSVAPDEIKRHIDIGDFKEAGGEYDLVCCIEVAEHIEPARSEELVSKIYDLSRGYIYFTAAPTNQSGHGHINCRPHEHWIKWFERKGAKLDKQRTYKLRDKLKRVDKADWIRKNSFIFTK